MSRKALPFELTVDPQGHYLSQERFLFRPRQRPDLESSEGIDHVNAFLSHWSAAPSCRMELCSGHGHWICLQAKKAPKTHWLAVEMKLSRAAKIASKARREGLENLFIACCEAQWLTCAMVESGMRELLEQIDVHFPDPWPKERHARHRLLQEPFLLQLHELLCPGSCLHLVSDDYPTCLRLEEIGRDLPSKHASQEEGKRGEEKACEERGGSCAFAISPTQQLGERYGDSYFENLWRSLGRKIYALRLRKEAAIPSEVEDGAL